MRKHCASDRSCRAARALAIAAVAASPLLVTDASAAVRSWLGFSGNWSVPANWAGGVVPLNGDDVSAVNTGTFLSTFRTVVYDYAPGVSLGTLQISGGFGALGGSVAMTQSANSLTAFTEQIGLAGSGLYTQSGGNNTVSGATIGTGLYLATTSSGRGTYNLSDTGVLTLSQASSAYVGSSGQGSFNQSGGTATINSTLWLGFNSGARGTYTLSGGTLFSGQEVIGNGGTASMVQSAGTNTINQSLALGSLSTGVGAYQLSGNAALNVNGSAGLLVGYQGAGTFSQSGGTVQATAANLGEQSAATGVYALDGGTVSLGGGGLQVGFSGFGTFTQSAGTLSLTASGASVTEYVGNFGTGVFSQSGGMHTVGTSVNTGQLRIADSTTSAGTYNLSGGTLIVNGFESVGSRGPGVFNQTGGFNQCTELDVGGQDVGTYSLSGSGMLIVTDPNAMNVRMAVGAQTGTARFLQDGGTVTLGNPGQLLPSSSIELDIGAFGSTGYYRLSGGSLRMIDGLLAVGTNGNGSFEQSGGAFRIDGLIALGGQGGTGTYLLSGGSLTANPVVLLSSDAGQLPLNGVQVVDGGTFIGGATDGVFAGGQFNLDGGTVAGVLRNQGTFIYNSGTFSGQLVNQGTAQFDHATFTPGQTTTNDELGVINASGVFAGPGVINHGVLNATGPLSIPSVSNSGAINVPVGASLSPAFIDNFGRVNLSGGKLLGSGTVSNNAGGLLSGGGTVQLAITQNGGTIRADDPATPLLITTPITISNNASQIAVAPNATLNLQSPLTNSAVIALQGPGALLTGATISNTGTIRGAGELGGQIVNSGILRAEGGALTLSNPNGANLPAGQIQTGSGTVRFTQGLQINSGRIVLGGGEFDNGSGSLSNSGTILGHGTLRAPSINNTGTMLFSGGVTDVFGAVNNQGPITVTGNSAATFYDAVNTTGSGTISVSLGSTAVFAGSFGGSGAFSGSGAKDFEGTASVGSINTSTGTTIVGPGGTLTTGSFRDDTLQVLGHMTELPNGTAAGTMRASTLLIGGTTDAWTGRLDVSDNDLVVDYDPADPSPLARIANQIKSGYAGGAWTGSGMTSSAAAAAAGGAHKTALGYGEASTLGIGSFSGQAVDGSAVLVRYTFTGDANLDGKVDTLDFNALAANFGGSSKLWTQADFNYDGKVDTLDFNNLAANFGQAMPSGPGALAAVLVPEPAGISAAAMLCAASLMRTPRRQRRRRSRL